MQKALAEIQATATEDHNPFSNLELAVEPRLTSATKFYMVADPQIVDGLEFAYLEGAPGPQIETRAGFEVDGTQTKVRLDCGCGWVDYRGWHALAVPPSGLCSRIGNRLWQRRFQAPICRGRGRTNGPGARRGRSGSHDPRHPVRFGHKLLQKPGMAGPFGKQQAHLSRADRAPARPTWRQAHCRA